MIVSKGSLENLFGQKRCLNGSPTLSEATYKTAERQKREQPLHYSRVRNTLSLIILRCGVCCLHLRHQSTCSSHRKHSWQT